MIFINSALYSCYEEGYAVSMFARSQEHTKCDWMQTQRVFVYKKTPFDSRQFKTIKESLQKKSSHCENGAKFPKNKAFHHPTPLHNEYKVRVKGIFT